MLSSVVSQIVRRAAKWKPPSWDPEDFEQEVWEAVLSVANEGETDPRELLRRAEDRVQSKATREARRPESPIEWFDEGPEVLGSEESLLPPTDFLSDPRYASLTVRERAAAWLIHGLGLDQRAAGAMLIPPTNQQGVSRLMKQMKVKVKAAFAKEE